MRFSAVIVAAGAGSRAGDGAPKQWRVLAGKPVARWSVEALAAAGAAPIAVVIPAGDEPRAAEAFDGLPGLRIVPGGAERADSVRAGLAALAADAPGVVMIHDAARPFVTKAHVERLISALADADGAVPALPVADTLKTGSFAAGLATVSREGLWRAQTPQAFRYDRLMAAYASSPGGATDDAAIVEASGGRVVPVAGDPRLLKLTYPEDFAMAEALAGAVRITCVGQGFDAHRFTDGDHVWLCGVRIPHGQGLEGHSDADAGLHALTDALLGAIGEGDIGQHFPPGDPQWRGASSDRFLAHAARLIAAKGGRIANLDITLICEAPKVGPHREAMRVRIAGIVGLDPARVSVKATTTERMGFTGRGEGLAAQAVVSVELPR